MLVIGLFAMLLHLLAGSGMVRAGTSGPQGFVPEICSSHGPVTPGPSGRLPQGSHDCCKLCAAGAPPMLPEAAIAEPSTSALVGMLAAMESPAPGHVITSAHRPRGPPAAA